MKRRALLKLCVFVLGGAIINVAVAWGFAIRWRCQSNIGLTDRSTFSQHAAHNEFSVGLPFRSLEGRRNSAVFGTEELDGLWVVRRSLPNFDLYLPNKPIWPGFAINTVFYASILWLLFVAPFAVRRRVRVRRGRCPNCAYPIGRSPVCTECGTPLPVTIRRTLVAT